MADDASITASGPKHYVPPTDTPERVLFRVQTLALLRVLGPKKGQRLLRAMGEILADQESIAKLIPIRPRPDWPDWRNSRYLAAAAFRADLPVLVAGLPR